VHVVLTDAFAGTERYVATLAQRQAAVGHHVVVIGGDPDRMPGAVGVAQWRAASGLRSGFAALRAEGACDVVHTHLTDADLLGAVTGAWHGARLISTRHIAARRGRRALAHALALVLQRRIDAEIAISEYVRRATGRPASVLRNGVDHVESRARLDGQRIVLIQRLEPEKDTATALAAWQRSGLAERGWRLTVAGTGSCLPALQASAAADGVEWLGWVGAVEDLLLASAALFAPAPGEPLGLSVLEAMSLGVPVVASAAGGHLETMARVEGALLFTAGDVDSAAHALRRLADLTAPERSAYGERLQRLQRAEFDLDQHVADVETCYRSS
jgi:glycosyltransferase involved in cell wall biosynthesis